MTIETGEDFVKKTESDTRMRLVGIKIKPSERILQMVVVVAESCCIKSKESSIILQTVDVLLHGHRFAGFLM